VVTHREGQNQKDQYLDFVRDGLREKGGKDVPNAHANKTTVPALDDLTGAELEGERLVAIERRVKLGAVLQGTLA